MGILTRGAGAGGNDHRALRAQRGAGAEEIVFLGGPRASIFLDLESYTGYQTILLEHPARLVIDLYGVQGDPRPCWKWTAPWSVLCGPAALMTRPCGLSAT